MIDSKSKADIVRAQGNTHICIDMYKKNLKKIVDDPIRFANAYLSFLNAEGEILDLNIGHAMVRKLALQHATNVRSAVPRTMLIPGDQ